MCVNYQDLSTHFQGLTCVHVRVFYFQPHSYQDHFTFAFPHHPSCLDPPNSQEVSMADDLCDQPSLVLRSISMAFYQVCLTASSFIHPLIHFFLCFFGFFVFFVLFFFQIESGKELLNVQLKHN